MFKDMKSETGTETTHWLTQRLVLVQKSSLCFKTEEMQKYTCAGILTGRPGRDTAGRDSVKVDASEETTEDHFWWDCIS